MRQENLKNNRDILLETRNLSVEFPLKKKSFFEKQKMLSAVSDVSIQIRKGETFWIGRGERLWQINVCQCNAWFCKAPIGRNLF